MELRIGNGTRVAAVTLGVVNLKLPSRDYLSLEECHYVPSIVKNIISISCLDKMGYTLIIKDNCCSIYLGSKLVVTHLLKPIGLSVPLSPLSPLSSLLYLFLLSLSSLYITYSRM